MSRHNASWVATIPIPGLLEELKVTVTVTTTYTRPVHVEKVSLFGHDWEVNAFFDEKPMGEQRAGSKMGFARSCWPNCAGMEEGAPCRIHNPNVKVQAVDLKVPAVSWKGKWWVVDQATAQRIAAQLGTHDKR